MANITKYPFADLEVGEGFTIPADAAPKPISIRMSAQYWQRKLPGRQFTCRVQLDGSIRVDRIVRSAPVAITPTPPRRDHQAEVSRLLQRGVPPSPHS